MCAIGVGADTGVLRDLICSCPEAASISNHNGSTPLHLALRRDVEFAVTVDVSNLELSGMTMPILGGLLLAHLELLSCLRVVHIVEAFTPGMTTVIWERTRITGLKLHIGRLPRWSLTLLAPLLIRFLVLFGLGQASRIQHGDGRLCMVLCRRGTLGQCRVSSLGVFALRHEWRTRLSLVVRVGRVVDFVRRHCGW